MSTGNNKITRSLPYWCQTNSGQVSQVTTGKSWSGGNDPKKSIPQAYSMSRVGRSLGEVAWYTTADPTVRYGIWVPCFGGVSFSTGHVPADAIQRLVNRLAGKVRGHDFNAGVSLGEANESLGMIGNRANKIANGADQLMKKNMSALKFIPAAAWLEAVYGWLPLMSDVYSAAEALAANLNRPRQQKYRATLKYKGSVNSASPTNWGASGVNKTSFRGLAILKEDPSLVANLQLDDPASIAWELLPYSFVADWFLPIGGYLSARNFLAKTNASYVISRLDLRYGKNSTNTSSTRRYVYGLGSHRSLDTTFARTVGVPSLPLPRFRPLSDVLSNWRHCLDGLALADQKLRNAAGKVR